MSLRVVAVALCALACAHAVPLRGLSHLQPAGPEEAQAQSLVELEEQLGAGVPVPEVQSSVRGMHEMLEKTLGELQKKHVEEQHACAAKLGHLHKALQHAKKEESFAVDRRVAAESRYHSKQREVEEKRQELLSLQRRIAGKTKDIEAGNVKREEERKAYLKKHGVHEDTLARAHSIVKAVKSEGMTAAEDAASLIELAATRHGFRAEGQEVLGKSGGADHVKRIHTMLDRLVASVESSLSTVRAHETRAQESWKAVKASIKKQIQALATRKGAVLQAAGQLQQEAVLLRQKVGEAKKQEEGTHQHVAAQRRIAAREQKDCEGTVDTIADEVNRRKADLVRAEALQQILETHHNNLLAARTGSTGASGATGLGAAGKAFGG